MPLLKLLLKGIKRTKGGRSKPKRKPITLDTLKCIKNNLPLSTFNLIDQSMLWAAFTAAFFGFLRASEFCSPSQSAFIPSSTLLVRDVTVLPNVTVLTVKTSKVDQFRNGSEVRLAKSGKSVCPYRAMIRHLNNCSDPHKPLFSFSQGSYLTRQIFSDTLKLLLPPSYDKSGYSSHSMRIGAATCAADKNTPAWLIKALGRWSSNCFEQYIRTPVTAIDKIPSILSSHS